MAIFIMGQVRRLEKHFKKQPCYFMHNVIPNQSLNGTFWTYLILVVITNK